MRYQLRGPMRTAQLGHGMERLARCGSVIGADYPFARGPVSETHAAFGPSIVVMARGAMPSPRLAAAMLLQATEEPAEFEPRDYQRQTPDLRDRRPRRMQQPSVIDIEPETTRGKVVKCEPHAARDFDDADYVDTEFNRRKPKRRHADDAVPQKRAAKLRPLLPAGERRIAVLGEFRQLLAQQLKHPDRLRDNHRLPCRVQVYEPTGNAPLEQLIRNTFADQRAPLCLLTELRARRLHLDRQFLQQAGTEIDATKLFLELRIEADPSADFADISNDPEQSPTAPTRAKRAAIPRRFTQPWMFRLSRDEAAYDLSLATNGFSLRHYVSHLASNLFSASRRGRWRALLAGKDLDTQLWDVPPPKRGHHHSEVREWLLQTLQEAGYDVATMVHEWEIHWRRRGAI